MKWANLLNSYKQCEMWTTWRQFLGIQQNVFNRNVSLKNCTAAEGSSYEFIFDQDGWAKSERKAFSSDWTGIWNT